MDRLIHVDRSPGSKDRLTTSARGVQAAGSPDPRGAYVRVKSRSPVHRESKSPATSLAALQMRSCEVLKSRLRAAALAGVIVVATTCTC